MHDHPMWHPRGLKDLVDLLAHRHDELAGTEAFPNPEEPCGGLSPYLAGRESRPG